MLYGVAIEKSCALFISSFRRWQTNRLEQRVGARIFIKIYFDFMSLLFVYFDFLSLSLLCFWAFRSRRVQCQKCEAVFGFFYLFLACDLHEPFASPKNCCWQSFGYPFVHVSLSLVSPVPLSRFIDMLMWALIVLFECHYVCASRHFACLRCFCFFFVSVAPVLSSFPFFSFELKCLGCLTWAVLMMMKIVMMSCHSEFLFISMLILPFLALICSTRARALRPYLKDDVLLFYSTSLVAVRQSPDRPSSHPSAPACLF